ncbi:DUF58 domain-containing protein [Planctomicrobium sp. SH664]|uniref:DUF58 domain-containing protein n=1 Tax=Planctomicrobium sp. SH664 TaxID=3448125 RepID=UPI003F5B3D9F
MRARPGIQLLRFCAGILAASLLTFFWTPFAYILLTMTAVLAAVAWQDYQSARKLIAEFSVERKIPVIVGRNQPFRVQLTVIYRGTSPVRGELRDLLPSASRPRLCFYEFDLPAGLEKLFDLECRIPIRGRHLFGPLWLRVCGPRRLIDFQQEIGETAAVRVLPETFASRELLEKDLTADAQQLEKIVFTPRHGSGTEFESLHAYRYGDDPRRIDWRTTARVRTPVVRRYQVEQHRDVMILFDCGRLMGAETDRGTKLDCAVDAGLNLARVVLQSGDRCGVAMFDDRIRGYLSPVGGASSIRLLAECVYDLQTELRESDFTRLFAELQSRQAKRSLVIIISDINDLETSRQFRASLTSLAKRHVVLFAALRTPALQQIIASPMKSLEEGARKAVAFRLLAERDESLHMLRRSGIHIVDVEPHQLNLPLINQFIQLRRRNLL